MTSRRCIQEPSTTSFAAARTGRGSSCIARRMAPSRWFRRRARRCAVGEVAMSVEECVYWLTIAQDFHARQSDYLGVALRDAATCAAKRQADYLRLFARLCLDEARRLRRWGPPHEPSAAVACWALCRAAIRA